MTDPRLLTRRERQLLDVLYSLGPATAAQVREALDDPPSYSTVRTLLQILVQKGHLAHHQRGKAYVYEPVLAPPTAARSAIQRVVTTFFQGSAAEAIAALLNRPGDALSSTELDRIEALIAAARRAEGGEE